MLPAVTAIRYTVPLREGGSLPGIVEADDDGTYVMKMRGAGQGLKVLVAEVIVAELAQTLGIRVPRLVEIELSRDIARYEADEEVQDLLTASVGSNLGADFLPGALGYDGSVHPAASEAADILWVDAFTANVDRTWANPNLLVWHGQVWSIDHGAALYFHHGWVRKTPDAARFASQPFSAADHVLADLVGAADLRAAHERAREALTTEAIAAAVDQVPASWLEASEALPDPDAVRRAYRDHLTARLEQSVAWLPAGDVR